MRVLFVLSTGRCGTQSLTEHLRTYLPANAQVEHEPIAMHWAPRFALRHPLLSHLRTQLPVVDAHLAHIEARIAEGQLYVETGWPAFPWLPYLAERFGEQFAWVLLVRHPLFVAGSLQTHRFHDPARDDHVPKLGALLPFDPGVRNKDLAAHWRDLSIYEKCLFQWLEINAFAREFADRNPPLLKISYESLFHKNGEGLARLHRALGMEAPRGPMPAVDAFVSAARDLPQLRHADLRRRVAALAARFGYDGLAQDPAELIQAVSHRYSPLQRSAGALRPWRQFAQRLLRSRGR